MRMQETLEIIKVYEKLEALKTECARNAEINWRHNSK